MERHRSAADGAGEAVLVPGQHLAAGALHLDTSCREQEQEPEQMQGYRVDQEPEKENTTLVIVRWSPAPLISCLQA